MSSLPPELPQDIVLQNQDLLAKAKLLDDGKPKGLRVDEEGKLYTRSLFSKIKALFVKDSIQEEETLKNAINLTLQDFRPAALAKHRATKGMLEKNRTATLQKVAEWATLDKEVFLPSPAPTQKSSAPIDNLQEERIRELKEKAPRRPGPLVHYQQVQKVGPYTVLTNNKGAIEVKDAEGKVKWQTEAVSRGSTNSPVAISGNSLVRLKSNSPLYGAQFEIFNITDGEKKTIDHTNGLDDLGLEAFTVQDGKLYASDTSHIYGFDLSAKSGASLLFKLPLPPARLSGSPQTAVEANGRDYMVVKDNRVYVVQKEREDAKRMLSRVTAYDIKEERQVFSFEGEDICALATNNEQIFAMEGDRTIKIWDNKGDEIGSLKLEDPIQAKELSFAADKIIIKDYNDRILEVSTKKKVSPEGPPLSVSWKAAQKETHPLSKLKIGEERKKRVSSQYLKMDNVEETKRNPLPKVSPEWLDQTERELLKEINSRSEVARAKGISAPPLFSKSGQLALIDWYNAEGDQASFIELFKSKLSEKERDLIRNYFKILEQAIPSGRSGFPELVGTLLFGAVGANTRAARAEAIDVCLVAYKQGILD